MVLVDPEALGLRNHLSLALPASKWHVVQLERNVIFPSAAWDNQNAIRWTWVFKPIFSGLSLQFVTSGVTRKQCDTSLVVLVDRWAIGTQSGSPCDTRNTIRWSRWTSGYITAMQFGGPSGPWSSLSTPDLKRTLMALVGPIKPKPLLEVLHCSL